MERKNLKQLKLADDIGKLAEEMHRDYQSLNKIHMTFRDFGNMVMTEGLEMVALQTKAITARKKRRKIGGRYSEPKTSWPT